MTRTVDARAGVDACVEVLAAGGVVVLPTDTVYGVAALATEADAVARLFACKGRATDVPIAVLCSATDQALDLADADERAHRLALRHWPGPLTLVLPRAHHVTWELGGDPSTIGVRCPDHPLIARVAGAIGPIATTSANRHGVATPARAGDAAASLVQTVDLIVDGGRLDGVASTVADLTGSPRILRQGSILLAAEELA